MVSPVSTIILSWRSLRRSTICTRLFLFLSAVALFMIMLYKVEMVSLLQNSKNQKSPGSDLVQKLEEKEGAPVEDDEAITLPSPLPLPHALRKIFSDSQLARLIPKGSSCPTLPWIRNLTVLPILIVGHNTRFGFSPEGQKLEGCKWPCLFTNDIARIGEADAHFYSILHTGVPMSNHLIQDSGSEHERKCPLQRFAFWSMESEDNYPALKNLKSAGFDITMTYRMDADVPSVYYTNKEYNLMQPPLSFEEKNKSTSIATAFISNCNSRNNRYEIQLALQKLLPIDSFGACHHNKNFLYDEGQDKWEIKKQTIRKYLFTLAFENSNSRDYVTEKMYQALEAGTVPIYIGTNRIRNFVPQNSVINVADFKSPDALAKHLLFLRSNPREYAKYLAWKRQGIHGPFKEMLNKTEISDRCRLCGVIAGENVGW